MDPGPRPVLGPRGRNWDTLGPILGPSFGSPHALFHPAPVSGPHPQVLGQIPTMGQGVEGGARDPSVLSGLWAASWKGRRRGDETQVTRACWPPSTVQPPALQCSAFTPHNARRHCTWSSRGQRLRTAAGDAALQRLAGSQGGGGHGQGASQPWGGQGR